MVKVAVLVGDEEVPDLVAVSYYDQKPVHFLSTICELIKWIECHKEVYCVETEQVEMMKFLCLNINNSYNHGMGGVDIADQLRNYYRFDHWSRQRKWWWSIFFWALGVLLVNTYVSYKEYMHYIGKQLMSHYEFRKSIALAWLDPTTYWPNQMKKRNKSMASTTSNSHSTTTISSTQRSTSSISSQSNQNPSINQDNNKKWAPPVNDKTLCPREGALWCWLDMTIPHLPSASNCKEPKCALHFWACKKKHRYHMLRCTTCGIHLCIA